MDNIIKTIDVIISQLAKNMDRIEQFTFMKEVYENEIEKLTIMNEELENKLFSMKLELQKFNSKL
jgi:hypothetical protein